MKINEAQSMLTKLSQKHENIEIYFDCPKCDCSFFPNTIVTLAIHITEDKKKNDK